MPFIDQVRNAIENQDAVSPEEAREQFVSQRSADIWDGLRNQSKITRPGRAAEPDFIEFDNTSLFKTDKVSSLLPREGTRRARTNSNTASDGTSNTILIGERESGDGRPVPVGDSNRRGDGSAGRVPGISDGTSNTINIGERESEDGRPVPAEDGNPRGDGSAGRVPDISDGTSNTINIGERESEDGRPVPVEDGNPRGDGSARPVPDISDGSSNTIIIGERDNRRSEENNNLEQDAGDEDGATRADAPDDVNQDGRDQVDDNRDRGDNCDRQRPEDDNNLDRHCDENGRECGDHWQDTYDNPAEMSFFEILQQLQTVIQQLLQLIALLTQMQTRSSNSNGRDGATRSVDGTNPLLQNGSVRFI